MKRIYMDIGNSRIKLAVMTGDRWDVETITVKKEGLNLRSKLPKDPENVLLVLTSVRKDRLELVEKEISGFQYTILEKKSIPKELLDYNTITTLGLDRYLSCLGAVSKAKKDVIVIDAGSAITIDYMSQKHIFKGGVIIPGKRVVLEAMISSLPELPLPDDNIPDQFPGKSTIDCIRWGVNGGFQSILNDFLNRYHKLKNESAAIIVTGGDAEYIVSLISGRWSVISDEYLLFDGMKQFLNLFKPELRS